jgi:succinoglycan biosynthesis protein ExoM
MIEQPTSSLQFSVPSKTVCVAIPTFRRHLLLRDLLESVAHQTLANCPGIEVLVIDNDPNGSARPVVDDTRETFPFPLHYVNVKEPGLSVVRNYALSFAAERFDLLAMIDDDELAEPQWLSELMRVQRATGADAIVGPVPPRFPEDAETWTFEFRNLAVPVKPDCSLVSDGYSGNCLLAMDSVCRLGTRFDPALNLAGGEDQYFFRQMVARGGVIAYAAEATATELIPPARLTANYMLRRSFRMGNTLSFCDRKLHGTPLAIAVRLFKGIAHILLGSLRLIRPALLRNTGGIVMAACELARGLGMLTGLVGQTFQEYSR